MDRIRSGILILYGYYIYKNGSVWLTHLTLVQLVGGILPGEDDQIHYEGQFQPTLRHLLDETGGFHGRAQTRCLGSSTEKLTNQQKVLGMADLLWDLHGISVWDLQGICMGCMCHGL